MNTVEKAAKALLAENYTDVDARKLGEDLATILTAWAADPPAAMVEAIIEKYDPHYMTRETAALKLRAAFQAALDEGKVEGC